ncbi:uncharacterized protein sstn isoform X2 [Chelonus insularis]|uniref:uncharacterized protein sstn isoform X2 n=1 Tax=Chelonus insularis TaxID=460826 RepID=UPI0015885AF8|nr:uncharacterized protein LOC118072602 isoform X2 [Chelonus insularis]
MVMAETERKSRVEPSNISTQNKLQWLRQRREALEEKLAQKNNELKNLCIDEAELTGILPPEIPLDPGESPPFFRRRVGTSFAYPQNLINKLKTNEADESTLELERQVQASIAKAAFDIFNDVTKGKAVRRKNRLVYQQSQKRLKELETRLNFIRQGYGRLSRRQTMETSSWKSPTYPGDVEDNVSIPQTIAKHKSKKPRPPLHSTTDKLLNAHMSYEKLIKSASIDDQLIGIDQQHKPSDKNNEWISNELPLSSSKGSRNDSDIIHDLNDSNDVYILPNQHSALLYPHDNEETSSHHTKYSSTQPTERPYRIVPNAKDNTIGTPNMWPREQKRQCEVPHYNQRPQVKTSKHTPRYQHYYHRDNISPTINEMVQIQSPSSDSIGKMHEPSEQFRVRHPYYGVPVDQFSYLVNSPDGKEFSASLQERELMKEKTFKRNSHENMSLSRRQDLINANDSWSTNNDDIFWTSDYPTHSDRFGSIDRRKYSNSNPQAYQTTVNNPDMLTTISKTSVQNRVIKPTNSFIDSSTNSPKYLNNKQSQAIQCDRIELPPSTRILLRTQSLGSVETWHSGDVKCVTPVLETSGTLPSMTAGSVHRNKYPPENSHDTRISYRDNEKEWYETAIDLDYSKSNILSQTMRNLEIPAESNNRLNSSQISGDVSFESTNFNMPEKIITDGRTIIHAGKYQPYKEVTKPFEMSDFYKYSTKFRKKMESTGQGVNQGTNSGHHGSSHVHPAQQRINISNQINSSCQSYVVQRGNDNIKDCSNTQTCQPASKDSTVV